MIEFLYEILVKIGYTHPIHPPMTHIPVGMVIGTFLFGLAAWLLRHEQLTSTARYCIVLGLLGLVPTVLLGYMDWQHRYAGAWSFPIKMKIGLAVLLLVLLIVAVIIGRRIRVISLGILGIYGLCLLNVTALGYFGGELIYGAASPKEVQATKETQISSEQFKKSCSACHPGGDNTIKAHLPLKSAPQLADFKTFLAYLRDPKARDGTQTIMPPFPADKLPDQQAMEIYQYIVRVLQTQ
jgi:uncharacterized membrane protein